MIPQPISGQIYSNRGSIFPPSTTSSTFRNNPVNGSTAIPGWSFHQEVNSTNNAETWDLVDWGDLGTLATYRQQVGYNPNQPNYALKLDDGDSITHNRFIVPDWGVLRLNLHTPNLQAIRKL